MMGVSLFQPLRRQRSSILSYRYRKYDTSSSKYRIGIVSVSKFSTWKVSVSVSVSKFQTLKYQYQYQYHLSPKQVSNSVSVLTLCLQGPRNAIKRTVFIDFWVEKWQFQANFGIKLGISPFDWSISINISIETYSWVVSVSVLVSKFYNWIVSASYRFRIFRPA